MTTPCSLSEGRAAGGCIAGSLVRVRFGSPVLCSPSIIAMPTIITITTMDTTTTYPSLGLRYRTIHRSQVGSSSGRRLHVLVSSVLTVTTRHRESPYPLVTVEDALSTILKEVSPLAALEQPVRSPVDRIMRMNNEGCP